MKASIIFYFPDATTRRITEGHPYEGVMVDNITGYSAENLRVVVHLVDDSSLYFNGCPYSIKLVPTTESQS